MKKLIILRHGESLWNEKNIFTGWIDIELSTKGIIEAQKAGKELKKNKNKFDCIFTSYLKRSIQTAWEILYQLDLLWIKTHKSWKLNERHYGLLQGQNKEKICKKYGKKQLLKWRRSYETSPPKIKINDKMYPGKEYKYKNIPNKLIPLGESLKDTYNRVVPYWKKKILPKIISNKKIIIVAHGNSIRALMKYIEKISNKNISKIEIPTGIPITYEYEINGKNIKIIKKY